MAKTVSLKLFHLVLFSIYFQSSALNMKLLSFLIKTWKLIRAFNLKNSKMFYILNSTISLCFEYLQIFTSGKEYSIWCNLFWIFQDAPWEQTRDLAMVCPEAFKQPGGQPGELIPDSNYWKDLVILFLMIVMFFHCSFHGGIPLDSTFIFAPEKLNAYGKHITFWPTVLKRNRSFW